MASQKKSTLNNKTISRVVVIGTSAGGLTALVKLIGQLDKKFDAPVLIVQHLSREMTGKVLLSALSKETDLICLAAVNGMQLQSGHVYLATPDHHLMIDEDKQVLITKGAEENRFRPAIDPLFRSAAVVFGSSAIAVLLTGYLDDGTAGMIAIKRCGGIGIVQDPKDAEYPDMPKNVLNQTEVDYCVPLAQIGGILYQLLNTAAPKRKAIPKDIILEAKIAKRVLSDLPAVNSLGDQVPFNCPGCGGVLWKVSEGPLTRYRCHTGHAYTAASLLTEQNIKIEETMWIALRMFEERKNLLTTMAKDQPESVARLGLEKAESFQIHIDRIKAILLTDEKDTK